jgi:acyl-CoA dehydrogenase
MTSTTSATYVPPWLNDELRMFRTSVRQFIAKDFTPHQERWRTQHRPDVTAWPAAGRAGILLTDVPREYGGAGGTFAHEAVVQEELACTPFGCNVQSIVAHYILDYGSEAQKRQWLPAMARGEIVAAIAMSEPGAGSDLQGIKTTARREGDDYVIRGTKTFVSNGLTASLVCVAARTSPGPNGISLVAVEPKGLPGYEVGRSLEKVGRQGQDTCELFFDDVRVPATNLVGRDEGKGFSQMMTQLSYERLSIGVSAVAMMEEAVRITTEYAKERVAFGKQLVEFQNTRFKLAECMTRTRVCRVFLDSCIGRFLSGSLDTVTAAMAKYWLTDCQFRVIDECVQLHGGYGYMTEYSIARLWTDSRVERIYGGTNEIMKEVIGSAL